MNTHRIVEPNYKTKVDSASRIYKKESAPLKKRWSRIHILLTIYNKNQRFQHCSFTLIPSFSHPFVLFPNHHLHLWPLHLNWNLKHDFKHVWKHKPATVENYKGYWTKRTYICKITSQHIKEYVLIRENKVSKWKSWLEERKTQSIKFTMWKLSFFYSTK